VDDVGCRVDEGWSEQGWFGVLMNGWIGMKLCFDCVDGFGKF
jgi:hypothetical protein